MSDPLRELLDRLALRDLAQNYARAVDRRDFALLESLFTREARLSVHYGDPARVAPRHEMRGVRQIVAGIRTIDRYRATSHFVGNQTVELEGDRARAETYCMAHHLHQPEGRWIDHVMSVRYADRFVREPGGWRFAERVLSIDWTEDRPVEPFV